MPKLNFPIRDHLDFQSAVTAQIDKFKTIFVARLHVRQDSAKKLST